MKTWDGKPLPEHLAAQVVALEAMPDEAIDYSDAPSSDDWSGAVRGRFATGAVPVQPRRVKLPDAVARILEAVKELEAAYPGRRFTPDGHLVGSIGEVVAAEALGLTLYPMGQALHDAHDGRGGEVQIKMTWGRSVAMYGEPVRLVVLKAVSSQEAEIVYDGPGEPAWQAANKPGKGAQRVITLTKLRRLAGATG